MQAPSSAGTILTPELATLKLPSATFLSRFHPCSQVAEDPYVRSYMLAPDNANPSSTVLIKEYNAANPQEIHDVLQNLENFRRLGELPCMCKLVAFNQNDEFIRAAFEFEETSLAGVVERGKFSESRADFYSLLLRQLCSIVEEVTERGIVVEEIIPSTLLLRNQGGSFRVKMLFEEREKKYDKIQEGIKVFASPQYIQRGLHGQDEEEEIKQYSEAIFQIGLFLLDTIYQYESRNPTDSQSSSFQRDQPLPRPTPSHRSYLLFSVDKVTLNQGLVRQKIEAVQRVNNKTTLAIVALIKQMIALPEDDRITMEELMMKVAEVEKIGVEEYSSQERLQGSHNQQPTAKPQDKQEVYETPKKEPSPTPAPKPQIVSLTTLQSQSQSKTIVPQHQITQILHPKTSTHIINKLTHTIQALNLAPNTTKKQYLDKSIYYGQVDPQSQKRTGQGIYMYAQKDIYFGRWKENSLVEGSYLFRNGQSFEGVVKNGKQGVGRYHYKNGNVYEGNWQDDVRHGQGTMSYPNGQRYEGSWCRGKKHGNGKYYYSNGTLFEGSFVGGRKQGYGLTTFRNGTRIEAHWNQTCLQGPGKVFYENGDYFEGEYRMSQKQGKGLYAWQGNETRYEGGFHKDNMQGEGWVRYSDHEYYQGRIVNGRREGKGAYVYSNGDRFEGTWKNDKKEIGVYTFSSGDRFEGRFNAGEMSYGVMQYENGEVYEGQFSKGQRNGLGSYRGRDGELICDGRWRGDKYEGGHK